MAGGWPLEDLTGSLVGGGDIFEGNNAGLGGKGRFVIHRSEGTWLPTPSARLYHHLTPFWEVLLFLINGKSYSLTLWSS